MSKSSEAEPLPGLFLLLRHTAPTDFEATVYDPIVCLIKTTSAPDRTVTISAGQCVVVSHDLPVVARVTKASHDTPYLALVVRLDLGVLRSLHAGASEGGAPIEDARVLEARPVDEKVARVIERYVELIDDPDGARVIGPLVLQELHYRLLHCDAGAMLRRLLYRRSQASQIVAAVRVLRESFREELEVASLARLAGMSVSSFHKHFRETMGTSPLQYQKSLRLTEARRLLRSGEHSVSATAFEVGYASHSQFSREYTRTFGAPPRGDVGRT